MHAHRLRFLPAGEQPDLPLEVGMHYVGPVNGGLGIVAEGPGAAVCFCVDRRGVWLTVGDGRDGVHVNGREVRRLAMLRTGDSVYVDGHELRLLGEPPQAGPADPAAAGAADAPDPRIVLRGLGGRHHGRSFTLDVPRLVGRAPEADIGIDDPAFAERHARIELVGSQAWLRDLGSEEGSVVNGERVRDALLRPGDQVVFDSNDRFVLEAPMRDVGRPVPVLGLGSDGQAEDGARAERRASPWRLPLVLLAALLIAGLLSLLLLYGAG